MKKSRIVRIVAVVVIGDSVSAKNVTSRYPLRVASIGAARDHVTQYYPIRQFRLHAVWSSSLVVHAFRPDSFIALLSLEGQGSYSCRLQREVMVSLDCDI